jgi:O-antigen/teichoic acid export membrane protein
LVVGFGRIAALLLSAVGVRLAGAVIGFVLQIVLARSLAPDEMGGWFLMVSLASFAGLFIGAGYPTLGLTVLARYHTQGRPRMVRRFLDKAAYDISKYALVMALPGIAFLLMAPVDTVTRLAVVSGLIIAPATAMIRLNGSAANAVRKYLLTIVPDFMGKSLLLLVFVASWIAITGELSLAVVAASLHRFELPDGVGIRWFAWQQWRCWLGPGQRIAPVGRYMVCPGLSVGHSCHVADCHG